jgi:hypothetical protein
MVPTVFCSMSFLLRLRRLNFFAVSVASRVSAKISRIAGSAELMSIVMWSSAIESLFFSRNPSTCSRVGASREGVVRRVGVGVWSWSCGRGRGRGVVINVKQ